VEVVVDVEVAGKTRAGVLRLRPGAAGLALDEVAHAGGGDVAIPGPAGLHRQQRPRGLRCGAVADPGEGSVAVRVTRLTPATVGILRAPCPVDGVGDRRVGDVQRCQGCDHAPGAVQVVNNPDT